MKDMPTPIFQFEPEKYLYNFVGMLGGGELYDLFGVGWIEDGVQKYKIRYRSEQTGKIVAGTPSSLAEMTETFDGVRNQLSTRDRPQYRHNEAAHLWIQQFIAAREDQSKLPPGVKYHRSQNLRRKGIK